MEEEKEINETKKEFAPEGAIKEEEVDQMKKYVCKDDHSFSFRWDLILWKFKK